MDFLSQLPVKSQTIIGCVRCLICIVSWPVVITKLDGFQDKDISVFNCVPEPSDVTKQLCYDSYSTTMSPLLTPWYFSVSTGSVLGILWVCVILYGTKAVRQIKREQDSGKKETSIGRFWCICLSHVGVEVLFLIVMMVLFCSYQTLNLPEIYRCNEQMSHSTHTFQMENVTCNDQLFRDKSRLNFAIVGLMASYVCVCVATMVYLLLKRKNFITELVQWESSNGKFNVQYADQINEFPYVRYNQEP